MSVAWRARLSLPAYIVRHPANRRHPLRALGRAAAFQIRGRLTGRPAVAEIGGLRMWIPIGHASATKVLYGSPPDWSEMTAWARVLGTGDRFIDVGANVGTYALWAASRGAAVIAVEPDPDAFRWLGANVALNHGIEIAIVQAAVADRTGTVDLTVGLDTENRLGAGRSVRATTLDELVGDEPTAGVKIDVEGFEEVVLAGATGTLERGLVRVFQLEWNSASERALGRSRRPVAERLLRAGYTLARPDDRGALHPCSGHGYGADVFAVRSDVVPVG
jgi:FkbM family methyltransferase